MFLAINKAIGNLFFFKLSKTNGYKKNNLLSLFLMNSMENNI